MFYSKNSQFVFGSETEKVDVCSIDNHIKGLNIEDCKVRVTNVDAQGSDETISGTSPRSIVIQVIGDISHNGQPARKFTETFVLSKQTNNHYHVLNDIFRYIVEEDEEFGGDDSQRAQYEAAGGYQESTGTVAADNESYPLTNSQDANAEAEPHTLTNSQDVNAREQHAQMVDQGIQQAISQEGQIDDDSSAKVNGDDREEDNSATQENEAFIAGSAAPNADAAPRNEPAVQEAIEQPEKPLAPEPTPAASPPPKPASTQAASSAPNASAKPAAPKTWANLVAGGNKVAVPAAPQGSAQAPSSAPTQPKATPSVQTQNAAAFAANSAGDVEAEQPLTPQSAGSEWQTARHDHGKKQTRPQGMPVAPDNNARAYIKNIGENIDQAMLKDVLSKFGEVIYLDINRLKNCAFAEFATPAAYQAAVAANPHEVNGERILVEERRVRGPSGFGGYGPRGGAVGRGGRGSMDGGRPAGQGRGGFPQKDGGRGSFPNRGRGGMNARGRGVQLVD
ncbi:MAG: hypothetical protein M1831_005108 [Alyxoria varia]|nr:MAG: hypothetical protein M1831_005108 [Alyxoria varia]